MHSIRFIYLDEQDMLQCGVKDMSGCISSMEDMFKLLYIGDYRMGGENANEHGIRLSFPKTSDIEGMPISEPDYRFMAMPAYLGGKYKMVGIKTYGSNFHNKDLGLPRSILMMSLLDSKTGIPLAYMSANILSAMRTGAVSGVGAKYLAKKDAKVLSIIGPGVMSRYTLDAFMTALTNIDTLKIKGRSVTGISQFKDYVSKTYPQIKNMIVCDSVEDVCKDSDVIFFGTTNAAKYEDNPSVKKEWLKAGALVISASALLVDTEFLSCCKLVADNYKMYEGWGEGNELPTQKTVSTLLGMGFYDAVCENKIQKSDIADLGGIILGKECGRTNDDEIILFAVGGMPVEDVAWAYECYQNALNNNIGTKLKLWDTPEL